MKRRVGIALVFVVLSICYYAFIEDKPVRGWDYHPHYGEVDTLLSAVSVVDGELPFIGDSTYLVYSAAGRFSLDYNEERRIPNWVAYKLTRKEVATKRTTRSNKFKIDPYVRSQGWSYASNSDYLRSGYNKGHLIPSSDRDDSVEENNTTFLLSNIAPQLRTVNVGVWLYIETKVKEWAHIYGEVYVIVGTICDSDDRYIGKNRVSIPDAFYKCIAVQHEGKWHSVGYIVPNSVGVSDNNKQYRMSVDRVERKIGLDLFPHITGLNERKVARKIFR